MLMKCRSCAKEFIPPRKNILNHSKCITMKEQPSKKNQKVNKNDDEESESEQNDDEDSEINIKQQPIKSNQLFCDEMICGSVKIDDSSSNNNTSIEQYISMINDEMNNLLKQKNTC